MKEEDEKQQILNLSENEIVVKKELRCLLYQINITNLIKEAIYNNKIENVLKNLDLYDSKLKSTKDTFDLIYRYLGEKIRKNELTLQNLHSKLNLLYILYYKSTEKILCVGGIEVLLPIFEFIYKMNDKDTNEINEIINKLSEILTHIFKDKKIIELAELNNFFSILNLFIEKFTKNQIKILSSFYSNIQNIKKYKSLYLFTQRINNILNKEKIDDDDEN